MENPDEAKDGDGRTALYTAASMGHFEAVHELHRGGASLNVQDTGGCTTVALMMCGVYEKVMQACADKKWTPLHIACKLGQAKAAVLLVRLGADRTIEDVDGRRPLEIAQGEARLAMEKLELTHFIQAKVKRGHTRGVDYRSISDSEVGVWCRHCLVGRFCARC